MSCPFCPPAPNPPKGATISVVFSRSDLCAEHLEMSGIPSFETTHPLVGSERPCHATCGCVPLTALTYLLRGNQHTDPDALAAVRGAGDGEDAG